MPFRQVQNPAPEGAAPAPGAHSVPAEILLHALQLGCVVVAGSWLGFLNETVPTSGALGHGPTLGLELAEVCVWTLFLPLALLRALTRIVPGPHRRWVARLRGRTRSRLDRRGGRRLELGLVGLMILSVPLLAWVSSAVVVNGMPDLSGWTLSAAAVLVLLASGSALRAMLGGDPSAGSPAPVGLRELGRRATTLLRGHAFRSASRTRSSSGVEILSRREAFERLDAALRAAHAADTPYSLLLVSFVRDQGSPRPVVLPATSMPWVGPDLRGLYGLANDRLLELRRDTAEGTGDAPSTSETRVRWVGGVLRGACDPSATLGYLGSERFVVGLGPVNGRQARRVARSIEGELASSLAHLGGVVAA